MRVLSTPSAIAVAVASVLSFGGAAWAGSPDWKKSEDRARANIKSFSGYTLNGADHAYEVTDRVLDDDGVQHIRFNRRYRGMRVLGGDLVMHNESSGNFRSASLSLNRSINVARTATVSAGTAIKVAFNAYGGTTRGVQPELLVYARGDIPALAYDVRLFGTQPDGTPMEMHVIVDASTALVLEAWDDIRTSALAGTGKTLYSGTVALTTDLVAGKLSLRDPSRGNLNSVDMKNLTTGTGTLFVITGTTTAANVWGTGASGTTAAALRTAAADAQYGSAKTWDYFKNVHGRHGIANDGVGSFSKVHYGTKYMNAFWSDSCFCMSFGDGDGTILGPLVSIDIAAHEMTHGITSRTANLIYSGESGGLNEATSDIFGTAVEYYAANTTDAGDYLIGEKVVKSGTNRFLRSMVTPSVDGFSADCWYSTLGNLLVHHSSGVANHFFYLLSEGTKAGVPSKTCAAGNTRVATGTGTLTGITRAKAEKIWYRALTVYMTSSTNYAAARVATINAATDLYGASSTETNAVKAAWSAVLVN
jgi:Zn-dependent metalloprotease